MNPPYAGNLHLKFIKGAIATSETVINLSPSGFFTNIGTYSTNEDISNELVCHLKEYDLIDANTGSQLFNAFIQSPLHIGIYKNDYTSGSMIYDKRIYDIYKKLRYTTKLHFRNLFVKWQNLSKYGVRIYRCHRCGKDEHFYDSIICTYGKAVEGIDFKNENEKNNFINSIKTWVYEFMFIVNDTNPAHLPWLGDYTKHWSDDDLYEFFDISDDEKDIINSFI